MVEQSPSGGGLSALQRKRLDDDGFVVLPNVLTPAECESVVDLLDSVWTAGDFGSLYDGEPHVRFVPDALQHSALVQVCFGHPLVLAAVRHVLGDNIVLHRNNGRSCFPGGGRQPLHELARRRGRPHERCQVITCLTDFTTTNGATRVIPGTHLDDSEAKAAIVDPYAPHPKEILVTAPRGAVIIKNSQLIHSGTRNSSGEPRRAVLTSFALRGTPSPYDWTRLPDKITAGLSPQVLEVLH